MRNILYVFIFSALMPFAAFQNVSAQMVDQPQKTKEEANGGYFSSDFLRSDYRQAGIVAYVSVKEIISTGRSDDQTDCVNFTGIGYCSFLVRAEVKELYKGNAATKMIEFSEGGEAKLIKSKDRFLGEKVVFLEKFVENGKTYWQTIENSTRPIEQDVLETMRQIAREKSNKKN